MSSSFQVFCRQFLGNDQKQIWKKIFAVIIVYLSIHTAGIRVEIAPTILYLMTVSVTAGMMWQGLQSGHQAEKMDGIFQLPFRERELVFSYVGALSLYTLVSKTVYLLALVFAVRDWTLQQMITAVIAALNACMVAAVVYSLKGLKAVICGSLWGGALVAGLFLMTSSQGIRIEMLVSMVLAFLFLCTSDAYAFYAVAKQGAAMRIYRRGSDSCSQKAQESGSVERYLIRYLMDHKNYLVNTLVFWGMACVLPVFLGQFHDQVVFPIGCALLSMNTPICILLSCNPDLRQAMKMLPDQERRWAIPYGIFLWGTFFLSDLIYLIAWQVVQGGVTPQMAVLAVLLPLQSAILAVWLEWNHPITNWKLESDLWHHPRKYLVPVCMLMTAMLVGKTTIGTILFGMVLLAELFFCYPCGQ